MTCQGCGAELAPSKDRPRKWCSDRCRKQQYAGNCIDCGAPTSGHNGRGPNAPRRCAACGTQAGAVAAVRERTEAVNSLIVSMWNDGATRVQIAAQLGSTAGSVSAQISELRNRGAHLPYRKPESVAFARPAWAACTRTRWLALARGRGMTQARRLTQHDRVLRALRKGSVNSTDFVQIPTCDRGKPIHRLAARIFELQQAGYLITTRRRSNGTVNYTLAKDAERSDGLTASEAGSAGPPTIASLGAPAHSESSPHPPPARQSSASRAASELFDPRPYGRGDYRDHDRHADRLNELHRGEL